MRDTLEVNERYVKNSCLNEEKSEISGEEVWRVIPTTLLLLQK